MPRQTDQQAQSKHPFCQPKDSHDPSPIQGAKEGSYVIQVDPNDDIKPWPLLQGNTGFFLFPISQHVWSIQSVVHLPRIDQSKVRIISFYIWIIGIDISLFFCLLYRPLTASTTVHLRRSTTYHTSTIDYTSVVMEYDHNLVVNCSRFRLFVRGEMVSSLKLKF